MKEPTLRVKWKNEPPTLIASVEVALGSLIRPPGVYSAFERARKAGPDDRRGVRLESEGDTETLTVEFAVPARSGRGKEKLNSELARRITMLLLGNHGDAEFDGMKRETLTTAVYFLYCFAANTTPSPRQYAEAVSSAADPSTFRARIHRYIGNTDAEYREKSLARFACQLQGLKVEHEQVRETLLAMEGGPIRASDPPNPNPTAPLAFRLSPQEKWVGAYADFLDEGTKRTPCHYVLRVHGGDGSKVAGAFASLLDHPRIKEVLGREGLTLEVKILSTVAVPPDKIAWPRALSPAPTFAVSEGLLPCFGSVLCDGHGEVTGVVWAQWFSNDNSLSWYRFYDRRALDDALKGDARLWNLRFEALLPPEE